MIDNSQLTQIIEGTISTFKNSYVTSVRKDCFNADHFLTEIDIPNCSVIGQHAFANCINLKDLNNLNKVVEVENGAFYQCSNLKQVALLNCKKIGAYAFFSCENLNSVNFPNCEIMEGYALSNCTLISELTLPKCRSFDITAIFGCRNLETLNLSCSEWDSYLNFPEWCFDNFSKLTNLNINSNVFVSNVGKWAFRNCYNLKSFIFPYCTTIYMGAFSNCSSLESVVIDNCYYISSYAFYNCRNISSLFLLHANTIYSYAFQLCTKLETVYLTDNRLNISRNAFVNTPITDSSYLGYFGSIYVPPRLWSNFVNKLGLPSERIVSLSSELNQKYVFPGEFMNSTFFEEVPEDKINAEIICSQAFYCQSGLLNAEFSNCDKIENEAFYSCSNLLNVNFSNCRIIGTSVFAYCNSLSSLFLPKVSSIGGWAFAYCSNITEISFPKATSIPPACFINCINLSQIYLPEAVGANSDAFASCVNLTSIYLPKCSYLGYAAFRNCSNLKTIDLPKCERLHYSSIFTGCNALETVSLAACSQLGEWYWDNYTFDWIKDEGRFSNLSNLKNVYLPICHYLGDEIFTNCTALPEIYLPNCSFIGSGCFAGCSNLSQVSIPECEIIAAGAFARCGNLKCISLPKVSSSRIDLSTYGQFRSCYNLESVYLFGNPFYLGIGNNFDSTPITQSNYLGYYGSLFVKASFLPNWISYNSYYSSRFVGLTDEEIAALE